MVLQHVAVEHDAFKALFGILRLDDAVAAGWPQHTWSVNFSLINAT